VFVVAVLAWALWFLDRRARASVTTTGTAADGVATPRSPLFTGVIVLSVLAVVATTVEVVLIGHSGAEATWSKVGATTPTGGEGGDG
jgi:hypothetical protein